jgi:hypothetical protein
MKKLKIPSRELAMKLLSEVEFEDRLIGFILRERTGPMPVIMYKFEEVVSLLNNPHPRIDFDELGVWVRKAMGDEEMAEQIAKAIEKGKSDQERSYLIKKLMEERLNQCRRFGGHG